MTPARPGRWTRVAVTMVIAAGCTAGSASPRATGSPSPPTSSSEASGPPTPPSPLPSIGAPPDPSATPIPDLTATGPVPLARVLLICEPWGEDPPDTAIACRDGAALALAALGPDRASGVEQLDVTYGSSCPVGGACPDRRPDLVEVLVRLRGAADALAFRVARGPNGELLAWPPTPASPPTKPAFDPPPAAAPGLDGAPPTIRDREPLPFCGNEDATGDAFDTAARRCFLDGIRAGSPVELVSRSVSTEGDPVVTVDRWSGTGSVVKSIENAAGWATAVCAITPIETDAVFVLAGGCDPADP